MEPSDLSFCQDLCCDMKARNIIAQAHIIAIIDTFMPLDSRLLINSFLSRFNRIGHSHRPKLTNTYLCFNMKERKVSDASRFERTMVRPLQDCCLSLAQYMNESLNGRHPALLLVLVLVHLLGAVVAGWSPGVSWPCLVMPIKKQHSTL